MQCLDYEMKHNEVSPSPHVWVEFAPTDSVEGDFASPFHFEPFPPHSD